MDENGKLISFENLGDFWLEINTPNLKIKAPIVEMTDKNETIRLDQGIGHHKQTSLPNRKKGNVGLSGHRWMPNSEKNPARKVFLDLDKLKIGDEVKVHFKGEDFIYKIIEEKIVENTELDILNDTEEPKVTIYACTPAYVETTKRLVFIGELVK